MALEEISRFGPTILSRIEHLDNSTAEVLLLTLSIELREKCFEDGLFFLRWVKTRDEADIDQSVKPFPLYLPYIKPIWETLADPSTRKVAAAKSRQMLFSWILSAFMCWWARNRSNQAVYYQTQKAEDADAMVSLAGNVEGRCQFIESHLPEFLKQKIRTTQGCLQYSNGSMIQALAGGADQIRGKVASLIVQDEFAFQPEARGVYTACAPLIQKGAKFIAVSTPNGSSNQFATLFHGHAQPIDR